VELEKKRKKKKKKKKGKKEKKKERTDILLYATAVNRTRTSTLLICMEGWNPNHWTTEARLLVGIALHSFMSRGNKSRNLQNSKGELC
jgi:hypothetical protein